MYYLVFRINGKNKPDLLCFGSVYTDIVEKYKYYYNSYTNLDIIEADSIDDALKIYSKSYKLEEV